MWFRCKKLRKACQSSSLYGLLQQSHKTFHCKEAYDYFTGISFQLLKRKACVSGLKRNEPRAHKYLLWWWTTRRSSSTVDIFIYNIEYRFAMERLLWATWARVFEKKIMDAKIPACLSSPVLFFIHDCVSLSFSSKLKTDSAKLFLPFAASYSTNLQTIEKSFVNGDDYAFCNPVWGSWITALRASL